MTAAIVASFVFTVALLVTTAYFVMGGLPLLILKHDVPLDARFVRGFFALYYRAAFWTALGAGLSYALWGRPGFAAAALGVMGVVTLLRRVLLPAMQHLGAQIEARHDDAVRRFKRLHAAALAINLLQLVLLVWGLIRVSRQLM